MQCRCCQPGSARAWSTPNTPTITRSSTGLILGMRTPHVGRQPQDCATNTVMVAISRTPRAPCMPKLTPTSNDTAHNVTTANSSAREKFERCAFASPAYTTEISKGQPFNMESRGTASSRWQLAHLNANPALEFVLDDEFRAFLISMRTACPTDGWPGGQREWQPGSMSSHRTSSGPRVEVSNYDN